MWYLVHFWEYYTNLSKQIKIGSSSLSPRLITQLMDERHQDGADHLIAIWDTRRGNRLSGHPGLQKVEKLGQRGRTHTTRTLRLTSYKNKLNNGPFKQDTWIMSRILDRLIQRTPKYSWWLGTAIVGVVPQPSLCSADHLPPTPPNPDGLTARYS